MSLHSVQHPFTPFYNALYIYADDSEWGTFCKDFFLPVWMPMIKHKPWVLRNRPIPPGIYNEVCKVIRTKIEAGVYEPSNSSYRSWWFCILKKNKGLWLVHSLEPLNAVTILHSRVPPHTKHITEHFASQACRGILDLYVGYDKCILHKDSHDYTTFQMLYGAHWLVTLPMGWSNSVPIFHEDVTTSFNPKFQILPSCTSTMSQFMVLPPNTSWMTVHMRRFPKTPGFIGSSGNISKDWTT